MAAMRFIRPDAKRAAKAEAHLAGRIDALSSRRLLALTSIFVIAIAALFIGKLREDASGRRIETALRIERAAADCAAIINVALVTGGSPRTGLSQCHAGGASAAFHVSASGDILAVYGRTDVIDVSPALLRSLALAQRASATLDLPSGRAAAAWRPLDNGETVLVAAPAADIFQRSPLWAFYLLCLAAIALVIASLMAAFLRQSRAAARAGAAVESLQKTQRALAGGRCSPWHFDARNRTVSLSRSLLEPLGLGARDREFTLGEITALVHPEDLRIALAVITGDTSGVTEGLIRLRDPGRTWSRAYFRTAPDATRFNRAGVAFDLSGPKSLIPSAAIAEARLKDAIESIPEAFVLWDAQGGLAAWNRRFASIFEIDTGELSPGLTGDEVAAIARRSAHVVTDFFAPDAPLDEESAEVELTDDAWLHISRRRTAEGGMVCVASNVTDLKRRARAQKKRERELKMIVSDLESSRRELSDTMLKYQFEKRRAEDASRSKSEFLANMSHELRTPLNAINGFSEIMHAELFGPLGDAKYKEYVSDILSSGQHLLELIEDILDMSRIEAGRMQIDLKRIDLERILQESARLVAKRANDAGVRLTVSVGHAPAAFADARAAKQVTLNLLSNAIKFTPPGGEVTLTAEADLDGVTVIVADSGSGISREHLHRLGAPFELVEDHFSKSRRGSGLGLALSKSLMDAQGGILALASQPGRGTVACAAFPRRKDAKVRLPQFIRDEVHILTTGPSAAFNGDDLYVPIGPPSEPVQLGAAAAE